MPPIEVIPLGKSALLTRNVCREYQCRQEHPAVEGHWDVRAAEHEQQPRDIMLVALQAEQHNELVRDP